MSQLNSVQRLFGVPTSLQVSNNMDGNGGEGCSPSCGAHLGSTEKLHDATKKELFALLSHVVGGLQQHISKHVISTFKEAVERILPRCIDDLSPSTQEEANTRMIVHVSDAAKYGYTTS